MEKQQDGLTALLGRIPFGRTVLACLGVLVLGLAYFLVPVDAAGQFVRYGGYWFTLAAAAGAGVYGFHLLRARALDPFPNQKRFLLVLASVVVAGGGILFMHADFGPKIHMDELVLASTAKGLHQEREIFTHTYGRWRQNTFDPLEGYVDKRPWLYPFAVSIVHDLSGYRPANPYAVNAILGAAFIGVTAVLGRALAGLQGAALMPLLWLSVPLLAQNATGSGMDMIHLFLLAVVMLLSLLYLRRLDAPSEGLLSLMAVLLAHARYEAPLFLVPVAIVIVLGWFRAGHVILSAGTILAAPLLIARLLHQKFFSASESLWELHSGTEQPFGFANVAENLPAAFHFFFNTGDAYANSLWVAVFGFPALIFFAVYCLRNARSTLRERPAHAVAGIFGLFLLLHFVVILCYHDGRLDRLFASRFALPTYLLLTTAIVVALQDFTRKAEVWRTALLLTGVFVLAVTLPMKAKAVYTHRNYVATELDWLDSVAAETFPPRSVIIDEYNIHWTLEEVSCLTPIRAYGNAERLLGDLARGRFSAIFLVERRDFDFVDGVLELQLSGLPEDVFVLEPVAETSAKPFSLTRVYRVTGLHPQSAEVLGAAARIPGQ